MVQLPMLQISGCGLQALTLVCWTVARFFMYASYFTIFGVLFGYANFGKMVAIDNTVNGLFGEFILSRAAQDQDACLLCCITAIGCKLTTWPEGRCYTCALLHVFICCSAGV
jgi:hypothetical protein